MDKLNIEILGSIGEGWDEYSFSANNLVEKLRGFKGDNIDATLNCYGGSIPEGFTIYNILRGRSEYKTANILGVAMSMVTPIACAFDWVTMPENGFYVIHNPQGGVFGDMQDIEQYSNVLVMMKEQAIDAYVRKGVKMSREELSDAMDLETWYTPQQALEKGFINEITKGAKFDMVMDLNKFSNVPQKILNSRNDNNNTMYKNINTLLGADMQVDKDGHMSLNKENLEALELALKPTKAPEPVEPKENPDLKAIADLKAEFIAQKDAVSLKLDELKTTNEALSGELAELKANGGITVDLNKKPDFQESKSSGTMTFTVTEEVSK